MLNQELVALFEKGLFLKIIHYVQQIRGVLNTIVKNGRRETLSNI